MFALLAMWLCAALPVQGQEKGIRFHDNRPWQEILDLAVKENKLIFMDCYTSWCGPCKGLARDVFTRPEVGDFFNPRFINVKYDMEKGEGVMLHEKYKQHIVGYPTLLLIDGKGKVVQQLAGYQQPEALIAGIRKASEGRDLFTLADEYQKGNREIGFMAEYIQSLNAAFLRDSVVRVTRDYLTRMNPADLDKEEVWQVMGPYVTDPHTEAFRYLVDNIDRYQYKLHRDRLSLNRQLTQGCEKELRPMLNLHVDKLDVLRPLSSDTVYMQQLVRYLEKIGAQSRDRYQSRFYLHKLLLKGCYDEVWTSLLLCRRMELSGYYSTTVHDYVRYLMQHTSDKRVLQEYLQALEELQSNPKEYNYHALETMAYIHRKLGHRKQAEELLLQYRKQDEEKRKEIEEFLKNNK